MVPGVAEYREPKKEPFRIFINSATIKNMDPTFQGLPVYVEHVDGVDLADEKKIREQADGFVVKSFYNQLDGMHWAEFIIVSEKGMQAIRNGWKLSNAYIPKDFNLGGECQGVPYQKEIISGEYEHLAIVKNPRYQQSKILTPEEFKAYNNEKEVEIARLLNSKDKSKQKGESKMALNLFKRQKIENSTDIDYENLVIALPKSGKEYTLEKLVNEMDKIVNMAGYANDDHMVKVGNEEMSVKDLVGKHMSMCNDIEEEKKKKMADEEEAKKNSEDDKAAADKKANDDKASEMEKAKNAADEAQKNYDKIKNANKNAPVNEPARIDLPQDQLKRGQERY